MAGDASRWDCENAAAHFIIRIDRAVHSIRKNLEQMDFENVDAKETAAEIADAMIRRCHNLIDELESCHFE